MNTSSGPATIHLPRIVAWTITLLLGGFLLAATAGCLQSTNTLYLENVTRVNELQAALASCNASAAFAQADLLACRNTLDACGQREASLSLQLDACESRPPAVINRSISNCTDASTARAAFTAAQLPAQNDFLTKYTCFWNTAARYQFGRYYDVASVAQNPEYSLPDVLECYWHITEFNGVRASTGTGVGK